MRKFIWVLAICFCAVSTPLRAESLEPEEDLRASQNLMEDMTWQEVQRALANGKTTVIIPTGGTEQTGPHIVLGKHNFILSYTAGKIAQKLGDTLVTPILPVVPEGAITPPSGHMAFSGTLSLRTETFAAVLEDTARSLKQHGFKTICFIGEHGGSQEVQKQVAEKLSQEWKGDHVKVIHVSHYYDVHNGQNEFLSRTVPKDPNPQSHGGLADTSEMLAVYARGVRNDLRGKYVKEDYSKLGVDGPSDKASQALGAKLVTFKIEAAVKQIQRERGK